MKWSEHSLFSKVTLVVTILFLLAAIVLFVLAITEVLPPAQVAPWVDVLFGLVWVGLGIVNWKPRRNAALIHFAVALIEFVTALVKWLQ